MALLGSGFDPGVTNVFCAYAKQNLFDEITEIDILDCNAGDHGYPFATNFNPEINLREAAHSIEDTLYTTLLTEIANGKCPDPKQLKAGWKGEKKGRKGRQHDADEFEVPRKHKKDDWRQFFNND